METTLKDLSRNVKIRINGGATGDRSKMAEWQRDAACDGRSYSLTLFYQGRRMTTNFYQGSAHVKPPSAYDVLYCLLADADLGDTFEEFCSNTGANEDSRKAERDFKLCLKQTAKLKNMLGRDFKRFLYAEQE